MIRAIAGIFMVLSLSLGVFLTAPVKAACAAGSPILTVDYKVTNLNRDGGVWKDGTTAGPGDVLQLYIEMHNTEVGTAAANPRIRTTFTLGTFTNGTSTARFTADNASEVRDQIQLTLNPASSLVYIPTTTRLTWDPNGDGNKEFLDAQMPDGVAQGGINLPAAEMKGCNQFIAQMSFRVRVLEQPTPTPTPSPSPTPVASPTPTPRPTPSPTPTPAASPTPSPAASPSPTPVVTPSPTPVVTPSPTPVVTPSPTPVVSPTPTPVVTPSPTPVVTPSPTPVVSPTPTPTVGGVLQCPEGFTQNLQGNTIVCVQNVNNNNNTNTNTQNQSQSNNQTVNVTTTSTTERVVGQVEGAKVPLKQPETGVSVLGLFTMFGAAPLGVLLARFGRGRTLQMRKEEEDLGKTAFSQVLRRRGSKSQS